MNERPLTIKELAAAVGRCRWYIWAARRAGFDMPQRRATPAAWYAWERDNPDFRAKSAAANIGQHLPTSANI